MLTGGKGKDVLTGGKGRDIFWFGELSDLGLAPDDRDIVTDFAVKRDKISLVGLDADSSTTSLEKFFELIAANAEFTQAGQLRFVSGALYGNTDQDSDPEFAIELTGVSSLALGDLLL